MKAMGRNWALNLVAVGNVSLDCFNLGSDAEFYSRETVCCVENGLCAHSVGARRSLCMGQERMVT